MKGKQSLCPWGRRLPPQCWRLFLWAWGGPALTATSCKVQLTFSSGAQGRPNARAQAESTARDKRWLGRPQVPSVPGQTITWTGQSDLQPPVSVSQTLSWAVLTAVPNWAILYLPPRGIWQRLRTLVVLSLIHI